MSQPAEPARGDISKLLRAWSGGDQRARDDAMNALARLDKRKVPAVEMRFFGGLTVMRDWRTAKAWLYRELGGGRADGRGSMETSR